MSFPRYPKYKDSGVEWLGEVPEHWDVKPLRRLVEHTNAGEVIDRTFWGGSDELLYTCAIQPLACDYEGFPDWKRTTRNDLLLTRNGTPYVHKPVENAIYTNVVQRIALTPAVARNYIAAALQNSAENLKGYGVSIESLNYEMWKGLSVPVPSFAEQTVIAAFLDRETRKIDELVAEQQRLIELLKEKRQAVISHAVTKGLNPHAPMKPSGIEWLGDVPAHWEVRRVKSVSSFVTSGPRGWSERISEEGQLFIQSGDLNDALEIEFATAKRVQVQDDAETARTRLCDGDIVVCITGAKTGNVAVCKSLPETAYVNQHLCLIRPTEEVLPLFLGVVLKSRIGQFYFDLSQYGLKQGLSLENVKEAPVLVPLVAEQASIVAFLDTELARFDTLTAEAQRAIALLQERRSALISAAVTGQIDVRHLAEGEIAA